MRPKLLRLRYNISASERVICIYSLSLIIPLIAKSHLTERDNTPLTPFLFFLGIWLLTMMTSVIIGVDMNTLSPVFASTNQSILLLTDLHLEECIKQLHLHNVEDALDHCLLADHELNPLLN